MAEPSIEVVFESRYEGNLEKHLLAERERLQKEQAWLNANPLEIRFSVDVNGIKAQVAQAREAAMGGLAKAGPANILGADGRPAQAAMKDLSRVNGLLQEINTKTFDEFGKITGDFVSQVEQISNGLQRISRFKKDESGQFQLLSESEKDVRTVKQLEDGLRSVNKELGREFADAKGRGDKPGQLAALRKQKDEVDKLVQEAAKGGLLGSSAFTKAENQQDRLGAKIAGMQGATVLDAEKKANVARRLDVARQIKDQEDLTNSKLKANKIEADQAERHLPNRAKYESEINRIYQERRKIFQDSMQFFQKMDKDLLMENRPDLANKAFNRSLGAGSQIDQADLDLSRALTDSQRRGQKEIQDAGAKALKGDVDFKRKQQAEYEAAMAQRLKDDVDFGQKRIREQAAKEKEARESAFRQELQDIKAQSERRIAAINREEARLRRKATSADDKSIIAAQGSSLRKDEHQSLAARYLGMEQRARSQGMVQVADSVRGKALGAGVAADREMARFESATRKSGHALDFHSSSLIRNAGTFLKWQIPMQAVMSIQRAFAAGVASAIRIDRQFATLQTVFSGTAEEAQMLKRETIELAIAQGRSTDEAMDSSIRWSRLGMTRLQVLEATRVSLMASNVAEISAADAAEKLSAIYATYKLAVGDMAGVLNRLNSISNNYNVTVKDLFEGIARVSGVAHQSGLALAELEGIIGSVVGATARPGQEIGQALKTIITRLADPKMGDKLKKAFDIDLTGSNGDLKDMSQIFRELADLYPTLNKAEQQRFLMITAGTRQASRMAQVMTEYRRGQALAAKAGFDHTASARENEKILQSLQSRIDSLQGSWTEFATALGDAGAMERAGEFMRYLQAIVQSFSGSIDEATGKTRDFIVNNAMFAELVERTGGGENKWFGTRSKFNREEVENTLDVLRDAKKGDAVKNRARDYAKEKGRAGSVKNKIGGVFNGLVMTDEEVDEAIAVGEKLLSEGGGDGFKKSVIEATREVIELRQELESAERASWIFDSMAKNIAAGTIDRETMVREFQAFSNLLYELPDGQNAYTAAMRDFNQILQTGDMEQLAEFMARISRSFTDLGKGTADPLAARMTSTTAALNQMIGELDQKKSKLLEMPRSSENDDALKETTDRIKELQSALEQVNREIEISQKSAFGEAGSRRINNYINDVMAAAKAFGDAFKDFTPDADGDPVERIIQRGRRALEMGRDTLGEIQASTSLRSQETRDQLNPEIKSAKKDIDAQKERLSLLQKERAIKAETNQLDEVYLRGMERLRELEIELMDPAITGEDRKQRENFFGEQKSLVKYANENGLAGADTDIFNAQKELDILKEAQKERQRVLEQQDEADEIMRTKITEEEDRLEQLRRQLDYEEAILRIKREQTDAGKQAAASSAAFRFGETDSDKDANQARFVIERAKQGLAVNQDGLFPGQANRITGQVLQDEATARAALDQMQRRNYEIDAERRQIAYDTVKAMREQTEEASKRYQLASREDQLRASVLARTIRDKGPVGINEFSMLGQNTRNALTSFLPNEAPGNLNQAKAEAERRRRELDEEQKRLRENIADLGGALEGLSQWITRESGKGGSLDPAAGGLPTRPIQDAATSRDQNPVIKLDIGSVNVQIKLNEEVSNVVRTSIEPYIKRELQAMEERLRNQRIPNSQSWTE